MKPTDLERKLQEQLCKIDVKERNWWRRMVRAVNQCAKYRKAGLRLYARLERIKEERRRAAAERHQARRGNGTAQGEGVES